MLIFIGNFPSISEPSAHIFSFNLVKAFYNNGYEVSVFAETPWWPPISKKLIDKRFADPIINNNNGIMIYRPRHLRLPGIGSMRYSAITMYYSYIYYLDMIHSRSKIEGIIGFGLFPYLQLLHYLKERYNVPTICSGLGWDIHQAVKINWLNNIGFKYIPKTTLVTVQSNSNLNYLKTNGFCFPNIKVYKRGINLSHLEQEYSKNHSREKLSLSKNDKILLYAGRMIKSKGIFDILESYNLLLKGDLGISTKLIMIGSKMDGSDQTKELKLAIHRMDLSNNVILKETMSREKVLLYMIAADVFLFPSYHTEGMPNVVLEAASLLLPIIAAKSQVIDEFVNNNDLMNIVEKKNSIDLSGKIKSVLYNYNEAIEKAVRAKKKVLKEYNIDKNISQIENVFNYQNLK